MTILQFLKDAFLYDVVKIWDKDHRVNVFTVRELLESRSKILTVEPLKAVVYPECGLYSFELK